MQAISFLSSYIFWLFAIIPVGAATMVTYHAAMKAFSTDEGEIGHHNVKIKQTIKGAVIGLTISGFITVVSSFYR
ncbi:MAG: hypothetical protein AB7G87_01225 [Clostridia bacterium]